jgi:hypothetical protein
LIYIKASGNPGSNPGKTSNLYSFFALSAMTDDKRLRLLAVDAVWWGYFFAGWEGASVPLGNNGHLVYYCKSKQSVYDTANYLDSNFSPQYSMVVV